MDLSKILLYSYLFEHEYDRVLKDLLHSKKNEIDTLARKKLLALMSLLEIMLNQ